MADIGNQLGDAEGGVGRFVDALDDATISLSSRATLEARVARESGEWSIKSQRMEKSSFKAKKEQLKLNLDVNKALKNLAGSLKQGIGKAVSGLKGMAKAGLIGGLVVGVKFLLDGMLKMTPDKVGRVIKIQKVENPKGGFPFFEVDNKNKDQIVSDIKAENKKPYQTKDIETEMPSQTVQPIDGALKLITQKLDQIVSMLNKMQPAEKPQEKPQGLPF